MAFIEPMHRNKPNITYLLFTHKRQPIAEPWVWAMGLSIMSIEFTVL